MPGDLHVAFGNVQNLFAPGVTDRGPQTQAELDEKLAVLSALINSFFGGEGPDAIGLAEVNTQPIFLDLMGRLNVNGPYLWVWVDPGVSDQTGLGFAACDGPLPALNPIHNLLGDSPCPRPTLQHGWVRRSTLRPRPVILTVRPSTR